MQYTFEKFILLLCAKLHQMLVDWAWNATTYENDTRAHSHVVTQEERQCQAVKLTLETKPMVILLLVIFHSLFLYGCFTCDCQW